MIKNVPITAKKMIALPKLVCSRTLAKVEWNNAQLINDHLVEEILKLTRQLGKDLALFASTNLLATLMQPDMIDEYRIRVNPAISASGQPLFKSTMNKHDPNLLKKVSLAAHTFYGVTNVIENNKENRDDTRQICERKRPQLIL